MNTVGEFYVGRMKSGMCAMVIVAAGLGQALGQASSGAPATTPTAAPAAARVEATPAIWKVQGVHETVYLFGTVHVMKPEVHWQTAKVEDAFKKSDTLYVEIADIGDVAAVQPVVMQLGMDMEHPLSTKISKDDVGLLDAAVKSAGMPGEQMFEPMQPWLVYVTLQVLPMLKAGFDVKSGVDVTLSAEAKDSSKPVVGFETVSQQMHYFSDLPQAQQVALLHKELVDLPKETSETDEMVAAWTKGDVEKIAALENGAFREASAGLYQRLVVERNQRWADQLATLLKSDKVGTVFVAVGAAHLAGPDSVQHLLEARGFRAVRR